MKDVNVTQVLFAQQVTTLASFSESGAGEKETERERACTAVGRQLQRAPPKYSVTLWPLCVTNKLI